MLGRNRRVKRGGDATAAGYRQPWLSWRSGLETAQCGRSAAASSEDLSCSRLGKATGHSPCKIFSRSA